MNSHPGPERFERFDSLDAPARLELLRHVRGCADCRRRLIAADPSRVFALLAVEPLPAEALDRVSRGVSRSLNDLERPGRRQWYAVASIAASLLLAGYLGLQLWGPGEAPPRQLAPAELAEIERILDEHEQKHTPVRSIELLSTPGTARVVDLSLGDTQVVMIFDADLDI